MIRHFRGYALWSAIHSCGRPDNVPWMEQTFGPATWYVPQDEHDAYREAGAKHLAMGSSEGCSYVRNTILDEAFHLWQLPALLLDDDFVKAWLPSSSSLGISLADAVTEMCSRFAQSVYFLAAARRGSNRYFAAQRPPESTRTKVLGGLMIVRPNTLRFDPHVNWQDDVDYGIQHVMEFGGAFVANDVLVDFHHRKPGGLQRTTDGEILYADRLVAKWPDVVKLDKNGNPQVRFPKREVLT